MTFAVPVDLSYNRENYLIFCGTARCGTTYISKVCQELGLDVQHERYGEDGIAAFQLAPFLYLFDRATIIHQTREPLKCISSCQTISKKAWLNISEHLPILHPIHQWADKSWVRDQYVQNCMRYYYYWNRLIETQVSMRHRIETQEHIIEDGLIITWSKICEVAGLNFMETRIPKISHTTNTRADRYDMLSWPMLHDIDSELCDKIKEMGRDYGYVVD